MKLQEQAWTDIDWMDKTNLVVVVPLGALEQHGRHLPLGVDGYLIQALAEAAEQTMPERVMLLPAVWMGHSPHHMKFPGTVSVSHQVYADMLEQIVFSLVQAGFMKFLLLNGHGGNTLPMLMAQQAVKNRCRERSKLFVGGVNYWNAAHRELEELRESGIGGMGHACEMETSLMLHLHPPLVRDAQRVADGRQPELDWIRHDMLRSSPVSAVYDFDELTDTGTFGDPTLATASKGKLMFDAVVDRLNALIRDIASLQGDDGIAE